MTSEVTVQEFCTDNADASLRETPVASAKMRLYSQARQSSVIVDSARKDQECLHHAFMCNNNLMNVYMYKVKYINVLHCHTMPPVISMQYFSI